MTTPPTILVQTGIYNSDSNGIMDPRLRGDDSGIANDSSITNDRNLRHNENPPVILVQQGIYNPVSNGLIDTRLCTYEAPLISVRTDFIIDESSRPGIQYG